MDETELSAQERLERKSLANVRALLDKIEAERRGVGLGAALVVTALVFAVGFGWIYLTRDEPYREPARPTVEMSSPEYATYVAKRIQGLANGPKKRGRLDNLVGTTIQLAIRIDAGGRTESTIEQSSRSSMTDNDLAAFVKFAEPFGSPPTTAGGGPYVLRARISARRIDGKDRLVVEPVAP